MSRYVDIEPYEEYVLQRYYRNSMGECVETVPLCGLPIADVQEVRHGRWDDSKVAFHRVCSECGAAVRQDVSLVYLLECMEKVGALNYCPNCGAKMNEVKK